MDIFEILKNENFFSPLTGKNKRIYFSCICKIVEESKLQPILYESKVKYLIEEHISNLKIQNNQYDELLDVNEDIDVGAIIRRFRECGWLTEPELGRDGGSVTNVTTACRHVIDFLEKMGEPKSNSAISNKIVSMYETLKIIFTENSARNEQAYSMIVQPLLDAEQDLKNDIVDLKENIPVIFKNIVKMDNLSSLGSYMLKDQFLETFFKEYFNLKHNGMIPKNIKDISKYLREFKKSPLFENAVIEFSEIKKINLDDSKSILEQYVTQINNYISYEYSDNIEYVDRYITKYYQITNQKLLSLTKEGKNIPIIIDSILKKLSSVNNYEKNEILKKIGNCIVIESQQYISNRSYQKRKRISNNQNPIPIVDDDYSEEEKVNLTTELKENAENKFSVKNLNSYFGEKIEKNGKSTIYSKDINGKTDALMFLTAIMNENRNDFQFDVDLNENSTVKTKIAKITEISVRRK